MALKTSILLDSGIECQNAYVKINTVILNYSELILDFELYYYYNQQTRLNNKLPIKKEYINIINITTKKEIIEDIFNNQFSIESLSEAGNNIIKQGYICLKTLPQFSDCIDVI